MAAVSASSPQAEPPSLEGIADLFCLFGSTPYLSTPFREPAPPSFPITPPPGASGGADQQVSQQGPPTRPASIRSGAPQDDWEACLNLLSAQEGPPPESASAPGGKRSFSDLHPFPAFLRDPCIRKLTRCLSWFREFHSSSAAARASARKAAAKTLPLRPRGSGGFSRSGVPELAEIDRAHSFGLVARPPVQGPFLTFLDASPLPGAAQPVQDGRAFLSVGWLEYCSWRRASLPPFNLRAEGWILPSFLDPAFSSLDPAEDLAKIFDRKLSKGQSKRIRFLPKITKSIPDGLPGREVWQKWCSQLLSDTGGKGVDLVIARNGHDVGESSPDAAEDSLEVSLDTRARMYVRQLASALTCLSREQGSFVWRLPLSGIFPLPVLGELDTLSNAGPGASEAGQANPSSSQTPSPDDLNLWILIWFMGQAFKEVQLLFLDRVPSSNFVVVGRKIRPGFALRPEAQALESIEALLQGLLSPSLPSALRRDSVFWESVASSLEPQIHVFLQRFLHLCVRIAHEFENDSPRPEASPGQQRVEAVLGRYLLPQEVAQEDLRHLARSVWYLDDSTHP